MTWNMSARGFAAAIILFFSLLVGIALFMWWRQASSWQDQVIDGHITKLHTIFTKIDADCDIIDFEHQKNYIDFLNVVKFVGSEIGSMNLARPENWEGPYLQDNPTIQEKQYQVVRTHKGYYIVPGEGVTLSNGKVVGKDIIFDENADIEAMMRDENALANRGYVLAAHLPLHQRHLSSTAKVIVKENLE